MKLFFRILLIGLGAFLLYLFGADMTKTVWYRISGEVVTGRISGFLASRYSDAVVEDATTFTNGKRKPRRPVFRYPVAAGSADSLEYKSIRTLFTFTQYALHERVTVVFNKKEPSVAYIFGFQAILMSFLASLFSLYMISLGVSRRG